MKYLIVIIDGLSEADAHTTTTLDQAKTENLDEIMKRSKLGLVNCVPDVFNVASDVANMAILGYDPQQYYTGRAYLEAVAAGISLASDEVVYRANLVQIDQENVMKDFTANNITDENAQTLLEDLRKILNREDTLHFGSSYHHLLVTKNKESLVLVPPHEITNQKITPYFKEINQDNIFYQLMLHSKKVINKRFGATSLWLWSRSTAVSWPSFSEKYLLKSALISAVPVLKGIGELAGFDLIEVEGATGDYKTNYHNKITTALTLLENDYDLVYLHIEACDYCAHMGDQTQKKAAIEAIDSQVFSEIRYYQKQLKVLILPDHHSSCETKMHERGFVPIMIYNKQSKSALEALKYSEKNFSKRPIYNVLTLMDKFIKG